MSTENVIEATGVRRVFGRGPAEVAAVNGVDLTVVKGETLAVVGPSGCGKSTLLHLLGGLDRPTEGEILLAGHRLATRSERALAALRGTTVGFVFQAFHLVDELTVIENVELPALLAGVAASEARRRAMDLVEQVGLADRRTHLPRALSGGQRQRTAVARALINQPVVVLADEPTGNVDSAAMADLLQIFARLRAGGQTVVLVTHDGRVAATADRVVSMRDGRIVDEVLLGADERSHAAGDLMDDLFAPLTGEA